MLQCDLSSKSSNICLTAHCTLYIINDTYIHCRRQCPVCFRSQEQKICTLICVRSVQYSCGHLCIYTYLSKFLPNKPAVALVSLRHRENNMNYIPNTLNRADQQLKVALIDFGFCLTLHLSQMLDAIVACMQLKNGKWITEPCNIHHSPFTWIAHLRTAHRHIDLKIYISCISHSFHPLNK